MNRVRVDYAIVFVSDMSRAVSFYRDVIGLPLRFESPVWTEFATEGATLALHLTDSRVPAGQCRPGLAVPSLEEFHERMKDREVPCLQEPKDVFGVRMAQYADPDGMIISVAEDRRS